MRGLCFFFALLGLVGVLGCGHGSRPAARAWPELQTRHVLLVMTDGLRQEEMFGGAQENLLTTGTGGVVDVTAARRRFWRETPEARRELLLPFMWSVLARQGQLFGDVGQGSVVRVTNGFKMSYPGYHETLTGYGDPRINSNDKRPNPNVTVLEWLQRKPAFRGKVAAFGAWDLFPDIFNAARCGFPVNAAYEPMTAGRTDATLELLNRLKAEMPRRWDYEPCDAITFHTALAWLKLNRPRILFLALGETDEWAHEGRYENYLAAAQQFDADLSELWETVQALPEYRGQTTLIVLTDHGRSSMVPQWRDHGEGFLGSEHIWLGVLGPDTAPLGLRRNTPTLGQNQVAATVAALLGENFCAENPRAGVPVVEVLGRGAATLPGLPRPRP
jgi:hypothetical protein